MSKETFYRFALLGILQVISIWIAFVGLNYVRALQVRQLIDSGHFCTAEVVKSTNVFYPLEYHYTCSTPALPNLD